MAGTSQASPGRRASGSGYGFGFLAFLGALLILAGAVGLFYVAVATLTTMILFGWLLLIGGVIGLVQAVQARHEPSSFWLTVAVAALNIAAGVILIDRPEVAASALTLFVALLFLGAGIFRVVGGVASMSGRMVGTIVIGVIDLALGILVLGDWPSSSRYTIGAFLSLALLFDGLGLLSLGLTGRRLVSDVRAHEWQAQKVAPVPSEASPSDTSATREPPTADSS